MPTADTVATLNQVGGKAPTARTRFKARTTDIFSPVKPSEPAPKEPASNRRASGKLKPKRLSQAGPSINRATSLSLPNDNDEDHTPAPKPRKKAILKRNKKAENKSPLKKHGYGLELPENPKVNLADSPAKNTRSKNHNPLETLAKANLPVPESLVRSSQTKAHTEEKSQKKVSSPITKPQATPRKRKRDNASGNSHGTREDAEIVDCDSIGDEDMDEEEIQQSAENTRDETSTEDKRDEDSKRSKKHEAPQEDNQDNQENPRPKKKRGRPPKDSREEQEQQDKSRQQSAVAQEQLEEFNEQEKKVFQAQRKRYAKSIEKVIQINECKEFWMNAGGAAYMIRHDGGSEAGSARGKAVIRDVNKLTEVYKKLQTHDQTSLKLEESASKLLEELDGRCALLVPTDMRSVNYKIVKDMFLAVIPALVILMKSFLLGRCHNSFLDEKILRELMKLLDMTIEVCIDAQSWDPQPSTLEPGIKRWVRNGISANLKRIRKQYRPELARYIRVMEDRITILNLAEKQAVAREAQAQRLALLKTKRQQQWSRPTHNDTQQKKKIKPQNTMTGQEIHDIDEIENHLPVSPSIEAGLEVPSATIKPQSQLRRESTADLPPPLSINLSEQEKMALLNGLQMYTGEDRYNDILNDRELGVVLRNRDLDDLVKAARSFSQMMASKLGLETYQATPSFLWLRSVDPDMRDNVSVEL